MRSAGPVILMCHDQEDRARACPRYAASPARPAISPQAFCDAEWAVIEPPLPRPRRRGRPLVHARRVIVNAIVYLNRTGCAWRYLPGDVPPWRTVYGYFAR
jgi:hypothetical protein